MSLGTVQNIRMYVFIDVPIGVESRQPQIYIPTHYDRATETADYRVQNVLRSFIHKTFDPRISMKI